MPYLIDLSAEWHWAMPLLKQLKITSTIKNYSARSRFYLLFNLS